MIRAMPPDWWPAELYLETRDEHDGLRLAIGHSLGDLAAGEAPYNRLRTTVDAMRQSMWDSKERMRLDKGGA